MGESNTVMLWTKCRVTCIEILHVAAIQSFRETGPQA